MQEKIYITAGGRQCEYKAGTTFKEIAEDFQKEYKDEILLVKANFRLYELNNKAKSDTVLEFITAKDRPGQQTYERSAVLLMMAAFDKLMQQDRTCPEIRINIEFSTGNALFITASASINQDILDRVKSKMQELVRAKLPIIKKSLSTDEAVELFHKKKLYDKERLFLYRTASKVNVYSLDGFEDYYYGYMVPDTSYIRFFDLQFYEHGFILLLPQKEATDKIPEFIPAAKVFRQMWSSCVTYAELGLSNVGALNTEIAGGNISQMILISEAAMEKRIGDIAAEISKRNNIKLIMIAGPSSSGKTTFAHRLAVQLRALGLKPYPIEVDDYFIDREHTPKDENGNYNFESLAAIDIEKFNDDMEALLAGRKVEIPNFNFKTGKREYRGNYLQIGSGDILILEGIHCLNDELSYRLPQDSKYKIYISALTPLNIDEHNRVTTTDARLIRRIVRDARVRGTSAQNTIKMWASVRRGEQENIFPYQDSADVVFNSALVYELAVLKQYAQPVLFGIERLSDEYIEAKRLLKFLDYFIGIPSETVPTNSIIREFIGGGCF